MELGTLVLPDGTTTCCGAYATYHDTVECCRACWEEVIEHLDTKDHTPIIYCRYCRSSEHRATAWTTSGWDLERFERNHSPKKGEKKMTTSTTRERREAKAERLEVARSMTDNTTERMRELAKQVGEDLEAEASFDPDGWEPENVLPSDIADRLGAGFDQLDEDDQRSAVQEATNEWRDSASEGVLDIRVEGSLIDGRLIVNRVILVLGTGGPHVEVSLDEDGDGEVTAYDWFGAGRTSYPVSIARHPLMSLVDYATEIAER